MKLSGESIFILRIREKIRVLVVVLVLKCKILNN